MGICQLCGEERQLIKAHIFPKWIFEKIKRGEDRLLGLSSKGGFPKRSRQGLYDGGILCSSCDNSFSTSENYAKFFLSKD